MRRNYGILRNVEERIGKISQLAKIDAAEFFASYH
jgi:hypothetical protein